MADFNTLLSEFMKDQSVLIVEPSPAFTSTIQSCLHGFGVKGNQIMACQKFEDAKRIVADRKPKVLITEYDLGENFGLALIEEQEQHHGEMARISIIVTKNSSDSAVSEAAEEQVDAYILKPFSVDTFNERLREAFSRKVQPSAYVQKIRDGKMELEEKQFNPALSEFDEAKPLNSKPSLAHYYSGHVLQLQGDLKRALREYSEGLRFNPLHYKCLIGQFEVLMEQKNYAEAYKLVGTIRDNYPLTSHRLGQIFIAAVYTQHFDDLPKYYELFLRLDQRTPWLVQLTTLALLTAAKFCVREKNMPKAMLFFDMATVTSARDVKVIEQIVDELFKYRASHEAQTIFTKVLPSDVGTPIHSQIGFKVDSLSMPRDQVIERGRKLVNAGHGNPDIYRTMIQLTMDAGKASLAESVIAKAIETHPSLRAELYKLFEDLQAAKKS